ncbi:hypothetical protein BOX15_Mlig015561g1, partial [Macrostomum lignano]
RFRFQKRINTSLFSSIYSQTTSKTTMKLLILLGLASLAFAFAQAAPLQEVAKGELQDDAFILDLIGIDVEEVKAILRELAQNGMDAAIELAKRMLEHAQGALKDILIKVLEILERQKSAYILDIIGIDMEQIKAILRELAEHGKQAAIELAKRLLQEASGIAKDLLVKVLEWLENRNDDAYILDIIGIDMEQIKAILRELAEHGKQAAIELAKRLVQEASGIAKDLLVKVLEWLENRNDDAFILDLIGIDVEEVKAILRELAQNGKQAAIELAKKMLQHAQGALKDILIKVLEILERQRSAYILDIIGIDIEQVKAILRELAEHGKQAAIELAKRLLQEAQGALKDILIRVLEWLENRNDDAFILDLIGIDVEEVKAILRELAQNGMDAAIELAKRMLEHAQGALKDILIKVLEILERQRSAYILDIIGIDMEQIKAILRELAEHGKQAAIELAKRLLQEASGIAKDLLVKVLEWLENRNDDAYILDIIGIDMEQIKAILRELAEHGKQAAIELAKRLLQEASGIARDLLVKVLEWLENRNDDAFILDLIGIDVEEVKAILRELAQHGKQAAIELAKRMLEEAQGALKDILIKVLEILERQRSAYILDIIGIDIEQVKAILRELAEHGKQAAIELAKRLLQEASGIAKDLLVKVLEWLENRNDDAYILDIIGIDMEQIKAILRELAEHGKQAAIELAKRLLQEASGIARDLLVKVLEWLENRNDDAYILDIIGIDMEQIKAILRELAEHGKQAAIELAKRLVQEASGIARDLLVKVLEWLENRN